MDKTDSVDLYMQSRFVHIPCSVGFRVQVESQCASYAKRIACLPPKLLPLISLVGSLILIILEIFSCRSLGVYLSHHVIVPLSLSCYSTVKCRGITPSISKD